MADKSRELYTQERGRYEDLSNDALILLFNKLPDKEACNEIIEGCQKKIMEAASFFETQNIYYMDLIQEANLALFMTLNSEEAKKAENPGLLIEKTIKDAMSAYCESENEELKSSARIRDLLNAIDEYCQRIAEEEEREVTSEELSKKLGLDEDDVKYLMRIALSAIKKD